MSQFYRKSYLKSWKRPESHGLSHIQFFQSEPWRKLRYRVLEKYGAKCMCCGATGREKQIHVDHVKPRSIFPELQFAESNLQVLCQDCNVGKGNVSSTDWRPQDGPR